LNTIRALLIKDYGGPDVAQVSTLPRPQAGPGQVLVRVKAAGLNGLDWKVREGHVRDAYPLQLPAVLGIELAGVIEAVGAGASRFKVGDRVMGPLGALGAYAEQVAVQEAHLCHTPDALSDVQAAAIPVAALAAWQSLHLAGPVRAGHRVLIHGAAGGLGGFAVQLAKRLGATVFATARGNHADHVRGLGADQVIDYQTQRFENIASEIDLVLDYAGKEVLDRSWQVLSAGGTIVGTSSPDILARTPAGRRGLWFTMKPDAALLESLAQDVASGRLQSKVAEVVDFDGLSAAIERNRTLSHLGKMVANMSP
jgi:NADPH:quinone reductase-like Zn-dependent oxidoreductase